MSDIKISIDDLPPATTVYNADVFVIDQLGSDGYTKKLTYQILKNTLGSDAFVYRAGDTMTGALLLNTATPSLSLQATPKVYVDTFLSKAGGTMTGSLILNTSSPTNALQATSKAYVQNNFLPISGIGTGEQNTGMTGYLTLCANPVSAFHAATKYYVDDRTDYAINATLSSLGLSAQNLLNFINSLSASSRGIAKAWVTFDGTLAYPSAVGRNYNVSSITKNSTGLYTITFATPMADLNYSVVSVAKAFYSTIGTFGTGENNRTLNSIQITTGTYSTLYDSSLINVVVFGN